MGSVKYRLLLLFLIPAVGMLYFSFGYVRDKFAQYHNAVYLESVARYVSAATELIRELQKERGLSIASLGSESFFREELEKQRLRTQKAFRRYALLVERNEEFFNESAVRAILHDYEAIENFRNLIDGGKASIYEILRHYALPVNRLVESTDLLHSAFVSEPFFYLVNGYGTLLRLAENSGRQRAIVSWMLENGKPDERLGKLLYRLEAEAENLYGTLEKEVSVPVALYYREAVPAPMEKRYRDVLARTLESGKYDDMEGEEWWKLATEYINGIYRANARVLERLRSLKDELKREAYEKLLIASGLWVLALLALYAMLLLFSRMLNDYARQVEMTEEQKRLYKAFSEVLMILMYRRDREEIVRALCTVLYQTGRFTQVWVARVVPEGVEVLFAENISKHRIEKELSVSGRKPLRLAEELAKVARKGGHEVVVSGNDPSVLYEETEAFGVFSLAGKREKEGPTLVVGSPKGERLDASLIDLLARVADAVRHAFEKISLEEEEERMRRELALMACAFESQEAITITDATGRIVKVNAAFTRITGYEPREVLGKDPSILKSGIHDRAFYARMWDAIRKKGYWKGEIYNKRKNGEIYPELLSISAVRQGGEVSHYVAHFFDITDLKRAQEQAEHRAQHDPLTQLFNRQKLLEELERLHRAARESGNYCAFIFFDLDNFKQINDSYGHKTGDRVLTETAQRLRSLAKKRDVVARIAGDEFAYIAVDLGKEEREAIKKVSILVEKIRTLFKRPVEYEGHTIEVSFSIGVKIFPGGERSAQEVIVDADMAMYHAKRNGKNQYSFFDDRLDLESRSFILLKEEFTRALDRRELEMYYQPQVGIANEKIRGFEALVRWRHPQRGLLSPSEFLHVTTSNRLNDELTSYTVREVCRQVRRWQRSGFGGRVSVNISAEQFNRPHFLERMTRIIHTSGIDPKGLEFEIVEDVLIGDLERSIGIIEHFRAMGVRFSIDDFGTGFSSINYLKKLPVEALKIDRNFVAGVFDEGSRELLRLIVEMAKTFRMESIVEGVEEKKVLEFLQKCGCDFYQGFLYSPAVDAEVAETMIQRSRSFFTKD